MNGEAQRWRIKSRERLTSRCGEKREKNRKGRKKKKKKKKGSLEEKDKKAQAGVEVRLAVFEFFSLKRASWVGPCFEKSGIEQWKANGKTNEQTRKTRVDEWMMIVIQSGGGDGLYGFAGIFGKDCCHQGKIAVNNLSSLGWVLSSVRSPSAQLRQRNFLGDC